MIFSLISLKRLQLPHVCMRDHVGKISSLFNSMSADQGFGVCARIKSDIVIFVCTCVCDFSILCLVEGILVVSLRLPQQRPEIEQLED